MEYQTPEELPIANLSLNDKSQINQQVDSKVNKLRKNRVQHKYYEKRSRAKFHSKSLKKDKQVLNQKKRKDFEGIDHLKTTNNEVIQKRVKILQKIFEKRENIRQFVQKTIQQRKIGKIIKLYSIQNKIEKTEGKNYIQKNEKRLERILKKPLTQEIHEFVKSNFNLRFRQLLRLLTEQKLISLDQKTLNEERDQRKKLKREKKQNNQKFKMQKNKHYKKQEVSSDQKDEKVKQKGKILIKMMEVYGIQGAKDYYKFIQKNIQLGETKIIQLWKLI